jgi:hypothetical protein
MPDFDNYIPNSPPKEWEKRFYYDAFAWSMPKWWWGVYSIVEWKALDDTAYNQPWVINYNADILNVPDGKSYTLKRREFNYRIPIENYDHPSWELWKWSYIEFQGGKTGYTFDTSNLKAFTDNVLSVKEWILSWKMNTLDNDVNWETYKAFERQIILTLADMQRVWSSDGNYNKDIIPTAWKVGNITAIRNSLKQLWKDVPSSETMFNQWSLGENPTKIICRDYAIASSRIARSLWFQSIAWTIEVWVSHAFTLIKSMETWQYYGVSADSVGGPVKIFEWKSMTEIRQSYVNQLLSLWRTQHFWWVFLDDNWKVIGKWQSDIEKRRSTDFLGGTTPTRLLSRKLGTDISLHKWDIAGIDYTSLIAKNWMNIWGDLIDSEVFFSWGITRMRLWETQGYTLDTGTWINTTTKSIEISNGFTARAYIAADINLSVGYSDEKWTQVPYLSGNSVVWGQIRYEHKCWIFITDAWKTYELSGPNQMQRPLIKLLPSGEYVMFTWEYKWESMNILGRAVFENYFVSKRRELSLWIKLDNWLSWAIYQNLDKQKVPGFTQEVSNEVWFWISWEFSSNARWNAKVGKIKWSQWSTGSNISAWINLTF